MWGTPVKAILDHRKLIRLTGEVREGQNLLQKWPKFGFGGLQKPWNGPKMVHPTAPEQYEFLSGLFGGGAREGGKGREDRYNKVSDVAES